MKYKKKPVIIEAEPYKEGLEDGIMYWFKTKHGEEFYRNTFGEIIEVAQKCGITTDDIYVLPYINTLEGKHYISPTDMIITGVKGERYPCKKDIFDMTYEPVES